MIRIAVAHVRRARGLPRNARRRQFGASVPNVAEKASMLARMPAAGAVSSQPSISRF
jgi:hypothetical protein